MITVYIFDHTGSTQLAQFFQVQALQISEKLSDVSTAAFDIPVLTVHGKLRDGITPETFREFNRITVTRTANHEETILFRGYIARISAGWNTIAVTANSLIGLLSKRILKTSIDFQ